MTKADPFGSAFAMHQKKRMISLPNTCFAVVYRASADAEFGADFGLSHTIHIAVQDGKLQRGELQGFYKFVVFRVIRLFLFKAVDGIHWQRLIIREVKVYNSTVNDVLRRRCKQAQIPVISVHGLRHTHTSLLLFAGVSIDSVARRLGHSSMTTTQKTYLHIIHELENKDIDLVMRALSSL